MTRARTLAVFAAGLCLLTSVKAYADPVTHWHTIATTAINAGRPGPPGLLDYALVQVAVHDAVQVIEGRFQPYYYSDPTRLGAGSTAAAVAAATHRALVRLYGANPILDAQYNAYILALDPTGTDPAVASGVDIGEDAANALYENQYRSIPPGVPAFTGSNEPGQWRSSVPLTFLFLAFTEPFTLNRVDQFRPQPAPPMTSVRYARDYVEVQSIGSVLAHPDPTDPTTQLARFWSGNFPMQWNQAVRDIAAGELDNDGDRARLLALANLAAADAAMAVWDSKYFYNVWRPSTAIRNGDLDGNKRTDKDAAWAALFGNDPNYPDYVSGANGLTGAVTGMLRLFFASDAMNFNVKNAPLNTIVREYSSFSQAAQEVVDARVLLGIHFRFADEEGRRLGERVAHWTFQKFLRPVPGSH
jgi:PAP2 superfamily